MIDPDERTLTDDDIQTVVSAGQALETDPDTKDADGTDTGDTDESDDDATDDGGDTDTTDS